MGSVKKIGEVARAVGDVLLPRFCVVCGGRLRGEEQFLCASCLEDIPLTFYWDLEFNPAADRINEIIQQRIESDRALAGHGENVYEPYSRYAGLFYYNSDNGYRHICHRLKYSGDIAQGRFFSHMLGEKLAGSRLFADVDLVAPVPLHWTRKWKRGYNQADIIAKEVAACLGARHCADLLVRCRRTTTQTVLSIEEKRLNVAGAFAPNPSRLSGNGIKERRGRKETFLPHHILIVDDVLTTGSTVAACHAALRAVFPAPVRISLATLACVEKR